MFTFHVYTVQILCLSSIMDEVHSEQEVTRKCNQENVRSKSR